MNTRPKNLLLRGYAEKKDGQWQVFCLDLCLAAQDETLEGAHNKLTNMIYDYVYDATAGEDKGHADQLLNRVAPLSSWAKYYQFMFLFKIGMLSNKVRKLFSEPLPLAPVCHHH